MWKFSSQKMQNVFNRSHKGEWRNFTSLYEYGSSAIFSNPPGLIEHWAKQTFAIGMTQRWRNIKLLTKVCWYSHHQSFQYQYLYHPDSCPDLSVLSTNFINESREKHKQNSENMKVEQFCEKYATNFLLLHQVQS